MKILLGSKMRLNVLDTCRHWLASVLIILIVLGIVFFIDPCQALGMVTTNRLTLNTSSIGEITADNLTPGDEVIRAVQFRNEGIEPVASAANDHAYAVLNRFKGLVNSYPYDSGSWKWIVRGKTL